MTTDSRTLALRATPTVQVPRPSLLERIVLGSLSRISAGSLTVRRGGRVHRFGAPDPSLPEVCVEVHDERFFSSLVRRGSIGAGESYARGWWTSEDPVAVVRVVARNESALASLEGGLARLTVPLLRLEHALRRNTLSGSRDNIAAHYDLSNEFFALFLDDTLSYSCGLFERPESTLREASVAKLERVCGLLELSPADHLLEIGTGWGGLAIHAAREYGCRVTTTTISREQHDLAARRIREAGLEGRITLLLEDYRRLTGTFDKLVSIEMIEAVGHRYYGEYFRACSARLAPGGRACLQAITIADQLYERSRRAVDFIQKYVFPGSCIPSVTALCSAMTSHGDLRLVKLDDIGPHYERTLLEWRRNLLQHGDEARRLGFDDEFLRLWDFYFCYCAGGFAERRIGTVHMVLEKPRFAWS